MQRYVRMFGTPITLLVLLAILVFGARWGYKNVVAPAPPPPLVPCTTQDVGKVLKTSNVTVVVNNGGDTVGLASTVASKLRNAGFNVDKTGNATDKVTTVQVIGAHTDDPEVELVASFFKGAKVVGDGRVDHTVEIRVGNPNTGFNADAPQQMQLKGRTVCLPSPSAIATPDA